jgi:uncharacterized protein YhhL (DUF1145 family)
VVAEKANYIVPYALNVFVKIAQSFVIVINHLVNIVFAKTVTKQIAHIKSFSIVKHVKRIAHMNASFNVIIADMIFAEK